MKYYETVSEALNDLSKRGYTFDFSLSDEEDCLYCRDKSRNLNADEFVIDEVHRFEGDSDPGDEMIIYAISSVKDDLKGTLLNAYGIYADSNNSKIVAKLRYQEKANHQPIKRAKELVQLSREHHHSLLLAWKIKMGLSKNIEINRIMKYVKWFYENHLLSHFEMEEKYIFTLLDESNEMRHRVLQEHQQIRQIIQKDLVSSADLSQLQNLLNNHIRFEERVLFNEIQRQGLLSKVEQIEKSTDEAKFCDNESDQFWK